MKEEVLVFSIPITTTLLLLFIAFFFLAHQSTNGCNKRPPGRRGWPLIGDSWNWYNAVAGSFPPEFVQRQAKRYGNIFSCSLFGRWAVVSVDPMFNRFVMQNEGKLFQSSYPKSFRDLVGKNGLITTVHVEQQRKFHGIVSNLMRLDKLKVHFMEHVQLVMQQTFQNLPTNQTIHLQDVCRKLAINLMVNQLLGVSSESEINEMTLLFSDFVDGCLSFPINLPGFAYHTAMKAREKIISKINKITEKRKQEGELHVRNGSVLERLLEEQSLPDEAVADFIINLLFAGNETTAKTMLFAIYFLTRCPQAMQQLLDEQDTIKNSCVQDEMLSWQDYKAMSFTQCVIDETLRLGGIAIWLLREAKEDVAYQDYIIPKGCFVVPFLSAVHMDENLYKDARTFNPWRWMDQENQEKRNWRNSPFYCPFGGGARFCPGAELARLQIALFVQYFVTNYRTVQECVGISQGMFVVFVYGADGGWRSCASVAIRGVPCCYRGVGLNVDNEKPTTCLNAVLKDFLAANDKLRREDILAAFFNKFEALYNIFINQGFQTLEQLYYKTWLHSGQRVIIQEKNGDQIEENMVTIQGLTSSGYLLAAGEDYQMCELHPDGNSFDFFKGLIRRKLE